MNEVWGALMLVAGGIFAGGAATFAWSRVPIWRRMPLPDYVRDFEQTIRWTDRVQPALLIAAAISAIGFAVTADGSARVLAAVGAGGFVLVLLASLAIMVPLQRRIIATGATEGGDVEAMRTRWFSGNLGRSILSLVSFALVAVAAVI
jgi:hypothetical protein